MKGYLFLGRPNVNEDDKDSVQGIKEAICEYSVLKTKQNDLVIE